MSRPAPGVYIYDFGQNMSGVERLHMAGPAGQQVKLRFAEVLNPDGTLYIENLRTAQATDRYTFAGNGLETFEPKFTFHGFRYVELTGLTTEPSLNAVIAGQVPTESGLGAYRAVDAPRIC